MIPNHRWLAPAALLLLIACAAPTGSLQIDIAGVPDGQDAQVAITGPSSYGQIVKESTSLDGLTPGTYSIQANPLITTAITSEYSATITPESLDVIAGETATASVVYALRAGTLTISVSGLPPGLDADVTVAGPDGFTQDVSSTTLLSVTPGEYSATARGVMDGTNAYTPTVMDSPVEVSSSTGANIDLTYTLDPGSLQVTITGHSPEVAPNVLIQGENGFSHAVSANTTLTDLVPGIYTATTLIAYTDHPIVGDAYGAIGPLTAVEVVSNGVASVSTSYALIPSSGRLWTSHSGTTIATGFAAKDLVTSGSPTPAATITGSDASNDGIAFDAAGNAWLSNQLAGTIELYLAADLAGDGSPTPSETISGLSNPIGLAFDASGNLFVANGGSHEVVVFTPDQLLAGDNPSPAVTISSNGGSLNSPVGLAFDALGNLWVSNLASDTVVRFGASDLSSSGSPMPELTIDDGAGGNFWFPMGMAFDASGALWIANRISNVVLKFEDPGSLSGMVNNPTPDVVLTVTGVSGPTGVAFDHGGSLWVLGEESFSDDLYRFDDPGSFLDVVSPTANAVIDGAADITIGMLAFYPPPENLPIVTP